MWTLPELVAEVATRSAALPAPRNGQVRAIPDERTVRYYGTLGLLDRPAAMRGRTALYGPRHAAQVIAIKRLQTMGRSLSEIQALWPTLDDPTLTRMSGVALPTSRRPGARAAFWKREPRTAEDTSGPAASGPAASGPVASGPAASALASPAPAGSAAATSALAASALAASVSRVVRGEPAPPPAPGAVELRIALSPQVVLTLSVTDESMAVSPADVRAIRAAAAPLLAELVSRRLASHPDPGGEEP
jgi:DNA-binding transcriptional MerR regulator